MISKRLANVVETNTGRKFDGLYPSSLLFGIGVTIETLKLSGTRPYVKTDEKNQESNFISLVEFE